MGSTVIKIRLNEHESFLDAINRNEYILATQIIINVCEAVHNNLKSIDIAKMVTSHHNITLKSTEHYYREALELNKNIMIKYEEYELCTKANKALEVLAEREKSIPNITPDCI